MPRTKAATETKPEKQENRLLKAVEFVAQVQPVRSKIASDIYCRIWGKRISASGPVLSASVGIEDDIECCPSTRKLLAALRHCPDSISLTKLPTAQLSIKSGNFTATIPCIEPQEIPAIYADQPSLSVNTDFSLMLQKVGALVNERKKHILYSSVLLMGESILASNGDIILQGWHSCAGPENLIVPKLWIKALHKAKEKTFYSLGRSQESLTAWFPDDSWIKTLLHHDPEFPQLGEFLNMKAEFMPTPRGLWEAIERLAPFSDDNRVYFRAEGLSTDKHNSNGAINICEGLPVGISFSISSLMLLRDLAEEVAFNVTTNMAYFRGHHVRGAIAQEPFNQ
jgi:hypothetical protein